MRRNKVYDFSISEYLRNIILNKLGIYLEECKHKKEHGTIFIHNFENGA